MASFAAPYIRRSAKFNVDPATGNVTITANVRINGSVSTANNVLDDGGGDTTLAGAVSASGQISAGGGAVVLATTGNVLLGGVGDPNDILSPVMGLWGLDYYGLLAGVGLSPMTGGVYLSNNCLNVYASTISADGVNPGIAWSLQNGENLFYGTIDASGNYGQPAQFNSDGSGYMASGGFSWDAALNVTMGGALFVTGSLATTNNTLDDGNGDATLAGSLYTTGSLMVAGWEFNADGSFTSPAAGGGVLYGDTNGDLYCLTLTQTG